MRTFLRTFPTSLGAILTFLGFLLILSIFPSGTVNNNAAVIASITSFLFGIFVSFTISNKHTRLLTISELLKIDEANFLAVYKYSHEFGPETVQKVRQLLDEHMVTQVDYYLVDYRHSSKSYYALFDYILTLKPADAEKSVAYAQINNLLSNTSSNRKQVEALVLQRVSTLEWVSLWSLLGLLYFCIVDLNTGTPFSMIASAIMATVGMLLVFVLRDLDTLSWQQDKWIWDPLHNLFVDLNLLPYYGEDLLKTGAAKPPKGSKVRVAHYKSDYPNFADKVVNTVTV